MTHTSTQRLFNETALNKMPQGVIFQALARRTMSWYPTKADLLAETGGYAGDENTPAAGEWVTNDWVATRDGYVYQVAASSASDHDEITAGSVKLYEKSLSAALLDARLTAAEGDISALEGSVAAFEGSPSYPDFAALEASNVALSDGDTVEANGVGYIADSGAASPTLTNAAGSKLVIISRPPRVTPKAFGHDASGSLTERTAALQKWLSSGMPLLLDAGDWVVNSTLALSGDLDLEINLNARLIGDPSGTFDKAVLRVDGVASSLPSLSADLSRADTQVTWTAAHGLAVGEEFILHDPTARSYGQPKDEYKSGEACRVVDVVNSNSVIIERFLQAGYRAAQDGSLLATTSYKWSGRTVRMHGPLEIVAPGSAASFVSCLQLDVVRDISIDGLRAYDSGATNILVARCLRGDVRNVVSEIYERDSDQEYAFAVQATEDLNVQGYFKSPRHGFTTTPAAKTNGSTLAPGIVIRRVDVHDSRMVSEYNFAADLHNATEYSGYTNCHVEGGVNLRGNHNYLRGGRVTVSAAQFDAGIRSGVAFNEMRGADFLVDGTIFDCPDVDFDGSVAAGDINRGVITAYGTDSLGPDLAEGGTLTIRNVKINAPATTRMIHIRNQGAVQSLKVDIDNVDFGHDVQSSATMVQIISQSGSNFERVRYTNITDEAGNAPVITGADEIIGSPQSGKSTVSWTTSDNQKAVVIVFPKPFPAVPSIVASIIQAQDNGQGSTGLVVQPIAISATQTTLRVCTADGSNFAAAGTNVPLHWIAMLG